MAIAMTNALSQQTLPTKPYPFSRSKITNEPVKVVGNSIVFSPKDMEFNKFYIVQLGDTPYIYRRSSVSEVEVYGLAD